MTDNLDVWTFLGRTDPSHTKGFNRAGGFKGTAVKPIYTERKMTELFGPVGTGWGITQPSFQLVPGSDGQTAVYCTLAIWYVSDGKRSEPIPGVGGDLVIVKQSSGLRTDDEAFKKAFTDAIGNAMKHLGMSADVHMGLFEDSKYLQEVKDEIAQEAREAQASVKDESMFRYLEMAEKIITNATDAGDLRAWWKDETSNRALHGITKGTPEYDDLFAAIQTKGAQLAPKVAA